MRGGYCLQLKEVLPRGTQLKEESQRKCCLQLKEESQRKCCLQLKRGVNASTQFKKEMSPRIYPFLS